ncbi:MAG TPA: coenzyme F420-0:L-glutamate ligase [Nocardioidaceae bacterium]|nr:coenzyme F420-0:L-glutamate ligase [Nocardioidaceae bacterium]
MITCYPVTGVGEVKEGDDLARVLASAADLHDGDVLVVTSKIVSKAEGRVVRGDKAAALTTESERVVARRGPTTIVRTHHGLVMAAAGIDASNTEPGTLVLLPRDPDSSARALREAIAADGGPNVGVLVSDTSGRAWRNGQTDIAIGAAGVAVLDDHAGRRDGYGNLLAVTAPAVADEATAAADLVTGKLSRLPAAVLRGLDRLVLPRGSHGPGAASLVRPEAQDMFGLGSREAVQHALARDDSHGFGQPAPAAELLEVFGRVVPEGRAALEGGDDAVALSLPSSIELGERRLGALEERARAVAFSLGWESPHATAAVDDGPVLRFVPIAP